MGGGKPASISTPANRSQKSTEIWVDKIDQFGAYNAPNWSIRTDHPVDNLYSVMINEVEDRIEFDKFD